MRVFLYPSPVARPNPLFAWHLCPAFLCDGHRGGCWGPVHRPAEDGLIRPAGQRRPSVRADRFGGGFHAEHGVGGCGPGAGRRCIHWLHLAWKQPAAAEKPPPDARPGHVVLEHGLPRLIDHRGADRGLVWRVYRAALGAGSRRIGCPDRRSDWLARHWPVPNPQGALRSGLGPTEKPPICTEALLKRPVHPQTSASALTLIVLTHRNCHLLVNLSFRARQASDVRNLPSWNQLEPNRCTKSAAAPVSSANKAI